MLFSEIYGSYFNVVAAVLAEAAEGRLTERRLTELVQEKAFAESVLAIPAALKNGDWPLLGQNFDPVIRHKPTLPLPTLQKRWLKLRFRSRTGARRSITCIPYRLEYSAKDDKFRLLAAGTRRDNVINLARVEFCELLEKYDPDSFRFPEKVCMSSCCCSMMSATGWNGAAALFPL